MVHVLATMLALLECVLVADVTCGVLISQCTTGLQPPPQTLPAGGEPTGRWLHVVVSDLARLGRVDPSGESGGPRHRQAPLPRLVFLVPARFFILGSLNCSSSGPSPGTILPMGYISNKNIKTVVLAVFSSNVHGFYVYIRLIFIFFLCAWIIYMCIYIYIYIYLPHFLFFLIVCMDYMYSMYKGGHKMALKHNGPDCCKCNISVH